MLIPVLSALALSLTAQAANIVLSNDDGWAEINVRAFYNALSSSGNSVVLSAPAENETGRGSSDEPPTTLDEPCEFDSCPTGSPPVGNNASMPRFNYVNSYPVTSMRYGIQNLSSEYLDGCPELAVAGPNVGANLGLTTLISGTVGAATEASKEGVPGVAFSGVTGTQTAWNATPDTYVGVYADLANNVTQTLLASGTPYLLSGVYLNVNFGAVNSTSCSSAADFTVVLTRIMDAIPLLTPDDVNTCGSTRLPTESEVVLDTPGCFASISVGDASSKGDSSAANQTVVLEKLKDILSCLPS